jgi:NADPH:quinone reductase-like Zn-dependent oxidoreductase
MAGPVRPRKAGQGADGGHPRRGPRGRIDSGPACPLGRRRGDRDRAQPGRPLATELGADRFLALDADRLEDAAGQADLVFDTIGGEVLARSAALLRSGGTLVTIKAAAQLPASRNDIRMVVFVQESSRTQLTELARLVDEGHLRPQAGAVYPLARAPEAYSAKPAGGIPGRIVLQP